MKQSTGISAAEFARRTAGTSYADIAREGGGILNTVRATRAADVDELVRRSEPRLRARLQVGVTTVEIKSGYGLEFEAERRMLLAARQLEQRTPVTVVTSLLGTDLYKFTMLQPMLHSMPANQAEYRFVCRNVPAYPLSEMRDEVERQIEHLCSLRFTEDELKYLGALRYMKSDFIDYLRIFQLQRRYITVSAEGDALGIVAKGPQIHVMLFEIFALAIVNESYFRRMATPDVLAEGRRRLQEKIALLRDFVRDSPRGIIR